MGCGGGIVLVAVEEADEVGGEFEQLRSDGAFGGDDDTVGEGKFEAGLVGGVIDVGDGSGDEVAEDVGVVGLGLSVVAAADDSGESGVEHTAFDGAGTLAEVAGVLLQEGGQERVADECPVEGVGVVGSGAFEVAAGTPVIALMGVVDFGVSGEEEGSAEVIGVERAAEGEAELLAGGEGDCLSAEDGVEVGDDAEDALRLLGLEFSLSLKAEAFAGLGWCFGWFGCGQGRGGGAGGLLAGFRLLEEIGGGVGQGFGWWGG